MPTKKKLSGTGWGIQSLGGIWGNFSHKRDAEAAAKRQRAADRQAGNSGKVKVIRVQYLRNNPPTLKLPSKFTPAEVRVNEQGKVQIRINPAKLGKGGRVAKGVVAVRKTGKTKRK